MRYWIMVMLLSLGLAVTGCGQKGPLFLPEKDRPVETSAPAQEPSQ